MEILLGMLTLNDHPTGNISNMEIVLDQRHMKNPVELLIGYVKVVGGEEGKNMNHGTMENFLN